MIIIHVVGGFGNQLYCYALYEKLRSLGKRVKLDIGDYELFAREPEKRPLELIRLVGFDAEFCSEEERETLKDDSRDFWQRVRRKLFGSRRRVYREPDRFDPSVFSLEDAYLDGYWNSEAYIRDIIPLLQQKIRFPESRLIKNDNYVKKLKNEESVFLHIRRSDYLDPSCIDRYRDICTEEYYRSALAYIRTVQEERNKKQGEEKPLKIYIFSDDISYAEETYRDLGAEAVDWNKEEESFFDCMLMSCCKYHICANSTFSMWAARLSTRQDKVMVRPLLFDRYQKITPEEVREEWKGWVLIDAEGSVYNGEKKDGN